ncbi:MAG: LarC family nickel insertion protein [Dehalococcoidia bacterium]|nr:LarC family nickel insertion protein [Dehalococcoidia bacterium]
MTLAALADAGASLDAVRDGLARLGLPPFAIETSRVARGGIEAVYADVRVEAERTYSPAEMRALVESAGLPGRVTARALGAIGWLERGEALAHRTPRPHLHEAGGVDAMVDIVGAMLALEDLHIEQAWCPVVTVGAGTIVKSQHGAIPAAPGPAAAPPSVHGYGAGAFDPPGRPNALRVWVGEHVPATAPQARVIELAANIDDMSPALLSHARDRLLEEGALDAWIEPIGMKKGRAASKLCALVRAGEEERFADLFLSETTTLGVRAASYRRWEAERHVETFESSFGPVRVKVGEWRGHRRAVPEFEDVKVLSARLGLPAIEVQRRLEAELGRGGG